MLLLIEDIFQLNKSQSRTQMKSQIYKTTASTLQKVANLPRYRHPGDLINNYVRPMRQQRLQIDGKLQFGAKLYSSQAQQRLVQELLKTRITYPNVSIQQKHQIADKQFDIWNNYLQQQIAKISQKEQLIGDKRQKIYESYLIAKQRNQQKIQLSRTVKLFYQISLGFKFDIPLHPLVMMRMVYPHIGYLNNYKDQRLSFDEFIKFVQEFVVASKLFSQGSTLHGSQLLSFIFWKAYTKKATLSVDEFSTFLNLFKFNIKGENLTKQLEYHLANRSGQIKENNPVRFDFWRNIYLERGL